MLVPRFPKSRHWHDIFPPSVYHLIFMALHPMRNRNNSDVFLQQHNPCDKFLGNFEQPQPSRQNLSHLDSIHAEENHDVENADNCFTSVCICGIHRMVFLLTVFMQHCCHSCNIFESRHRSRERPAPACRRRHLHRAPRVGRRRTLRLF